MRRFCLIFAVALLLAGCGTTPTTTINTDWSNGTGNGGSSGSGEPTTAIPPATGMVAFIEDIGSSGNATSQSPTRYLYAVNNNGTDLKKLFDHPMDFHSAYLLPDGSKLVFAAHAADGYSQIYLAALDGSAEQQLTTSPCNKTSPMLSADGSKIVFQQSSPIQNDDGWSWDIAVMNADGTNLYVIPPLPGWGISHPAISPDGSTIVAAFWEGGFGGDMALFLMNTDGSNPRRITPGGLDGILPVAPAFSPDGHQIVFSSVGWNDLSIYIMNVDGTGLHRIGPVNQRWGDPLFIGDRIVFFKDSEIYSMKPDGTDVRRITNNSYEDAFELDI